MAVVEGHEKLVAKLVKRGCKVNNLCGGYGSALAAAAACGKTGIVSQLLEAKAEVNLVGGCYGTALRAAAANGHTKIVRKLIDAHADVDARGTYFGTALEIAKELSLDDVVAILLEKGADPNLTGNLHPRHDYFSETHLRTLIEGTWTGHYYYTKYDITRNDGPMQLSFSMTKTSIPGVIDEYGLLAYGQDSVGDFSVYGIVTERGHMNFIKEYNAGFCWFYSGTLYENRSSNVVASIGGTWGKQDETQGTFQMQREAVLVRSQSYDKDRSPGQIFNSHTKRAATTLF
jgi:hypothetical protein